MIKRAPRVNEGYYRLDHKIARDKRLGWAARGLLIYLLTRPDNWEVSVTNLINEVSDSSQRTGRDATYKIINQLIDAGYMARVQSRNEDGSLGEQEIIVGENPEIVTKCIEKTIKPPLTENPEAACPPLTDLPDTAEPDTAEPDTAEPDTVKPTQRINEYKELSNQTEKQGKEKRSRTTMSADERMSNKEEFPDFLTVARAWFKHGNSRIVPTDAGLYRKHVSDAGHERQFLIGAQNYLNDKASQRNPTYQNLGNFIRQESWLMFADVKPGPIHLDGAPEPVAEATDDEKRKAEVRAARIERRQKLREEGII